MGTQFRVTGRTGGRVGQEPFPERPCGQGGTAGSSPLSSRLSSEPLVCAGPLPHTTPFPESGAQAPAGAAASRIGYISHTKTQVGEEGTRDAFQGSQKASFLIARCVSGRRAVSKHTRCLAATEQPQPSVKSAFAPRLSWGELRGPLWVGQGGA